MLPEKSNPRLLQQKFFGRRQSFEITRDHQLAIAVSSPGKIEKWQLPLRNLGLSTWRTKHFYWQPLLFVVPLVLLSCAALYGAVWTFSQNKDGTVFVFIALVIGAVAAFFGYLIRDRSYDILSFPRDGGGNLVLWFNNPSTNEFKVFVELLNKAIKEAQDLPVPGDKSLASEIERLKGLHEKGLLSDAQFEAGKNKLLGIEPDRRMGF